MPSAFHKLRAPHEHGAQNEGALVFSIEQSYRHYQFYSNMAVALLLAYLSRATAGAIAVQCSLRAELIGGGLLLGIVACLVFSARDCLRGYYADLRALNAER